MPKAGVVAKPSESTAATLDKAAKGKPQVGKKPQGKPVAAPAPSSVRKIIYPEFDVRLFVGDEAMTEEQAKTLLGWVEETDTAKFGKDHLFKSKDECTLIDVNGKRVRCYNNGINTPFVPQVAKEYQGVMLRNEWKGLNGENLIIGKTGEIISAQHRLIAFILCVQEWLNNQEQWKEYWPSKPVFECSVAFGVEETDDVVNTIDTGKGRSLDDVIYRGPWFGKEKHKDRIGLSKIAAHAIKLVWHRTGEKENAWCPRIPHDEFIRFLDSHDRLVKATKHIYQEDGDGGISGNSTRAQVVSAGQATGLLYLMACAASDRAKYIEAGRVESKLDWSLWDKACEFWVDIAANGKPIQPLLNICLPAQTVGDGERHAFIKGTDTAASNKERYALLAKAWLRYSDGKPITPESLELPYIEEDGLNHLNWEPTFGGIDQEEKEAEPEEPPAEEEIKKKASEIKNKNLQALKEAHKKKQQKEHPPEGLTEAGKKAQAEQQAAKSNGAKPKPAPARAAAASPAPATLPMKKPTKIQQEQTAKAAAADAAKANGK